MHNVKKPHLPPISKYSGLIERLYETHQLTNGGQFFDELAINLQEYLGVKNILPVANGTLALQIAYKLLGLKGNVATTPYTFAATASSLQWEGLNPVFVDVDEHTLNMDVTCLEKTLNEHNIQAILPVHVFGNPCEVESIAELSKKYSVPVIYDAAHAFGSQYAGSSVLSWGNVSTLSFHATKLFHTVEGGALVIEDPVLFEKAKRMINFGYDDKQQIPIDIGINAKMSEFHAAMGVCLIDEIDDVIARRLAIVNRYRDRLERNVRWQRWHEKSTCNGAYMPVRLFNETQVIKTIEYAASQDISLRRYFYPSLSEVPVYGGIGYTPIANRASRESLCLPLYYGIKDEDVDFVCDTILKVI